MTGGRKGYGSPAHQALDNRESLKMLFMEVEAAGDRDGKPTSEAVTIAKRLEGEDFSYFSTGSLAFF